MKNVDEPRTRKPNLWRAACELARFNIPVETVEMIVTLSGPMLKEADHDEQ